VVIGPAIPQLRSITRTPCRTPAIYFSLPLAPAPPLAGAPAPRFVAAVDFRRFEQMFLGTWNFTANALLGKLTSAILTPASVPP